MKIIDFFAKIIAESDFAQQAKAAAAARILAQKNEVNQQRIAHRRQLILNALGREGLTSSDRDKLLAWAEPGTLTGDEALKLIAVLRSASENSRRGRGLLNNEVPQPPFASLIYRWLQHWSIMHSSSTSPNVRLQAVKKMNWWPETVEAMYRAELAQAQMNTDGLLNLTPSKAAEERVSQAIGVGTSSVRSLCCQARQDQNKNRAHHVEPIPVKRFERWLREGGMLFDEQR